MPQQDLDQGGIYTQWNRIWYGPTVGWRYVPILAGNLSNVVLGATEQILAAGTTTLNPASCIVEVNVAGLVTVQLNSSIPGSQPTDYLGWPIIISDIGGHFTAFPLTILPDGAETIMGLSSITLSNDFSSITLLPRASGGWGIVG